MKKISIIILLLVVIISGCSNNSNATNSDNKVKIVTTIYPIYSLVRDLTENKNVELSTIYPSNADLHAYELTAKNIQDINDADYVFYMSDTLEHDFKDVKTKGKMINISETSSFKKSLPADLYDATGLIDPHVWIDPNMDIYINNVIHETLIEDKNLDKALLSKNKDKINGELAKLIDQYKELGKTTDKTVITSHAAFNYFNNYDIKTKGMYGLHHDDEPSSADVIDTVNLIKKENINTIYSEQNDEHNEIIEQLSKESGAKIGILNNMASVDENTINSNTTLVQLLKNNLETLKGL